MVRKKGHSNCSGALKVYVRVSHQNKILELDVLLFTIVDRCMAQILSTYVFLANPVLVALKSFLSSLRINCWRKQKTEL